MTECRRPRSGYVKRLTLILAALLAAVLAAGCGSDDSTSTTEPPNGDELLVEYIRGGGFAPSLQKLTIQADGGAVLESGYEPDPPIRQEFELTAAALDELTAAVAAADLDAVEQGGAVCADCFDYEIRTEGAEAELTEADLLDGSDAVVPIEVLDLMDLLGGIVEENAKDTPAIGG